MSLRASLTAVVCLVTTLAAQDARRTKPANPPAAPGGAAVRTAQQEVEHLLTADVHGPVNLVAGADRNADVVAALAAAWHRPAVLPVPAFALRLVLRDFAQEVLGSVRVVPAALTASGFVPDHGDIATAAAWVKDASTAR